MIRPVKGFTAADGTFFEDELEARRWEAEVRLRDVFTAQFPKGDVNVFMGVIGRLEFELREYVNANQPASPHEPNHAEVADREESITDVPTKADDSIGHVSGTEEDIKGVLKLPTRRLSYVSDVRGGSHAKAVSDGGEVDGA